MAAYLTATLAVIAVLGAPRVLAQGLSDPTRPPREILGGSAGAYETEVRFYQQIAPQAPQCITRCCSASIKSVTGKKGESTEISATATANPASCQ